MRMQYERIVVQTSREEIRTVADRWRTQYPNPAKGWAMAGVQAKLDALDLETATAEEVEKIIGNQSWTRTRCDICGETVDLWARLGEEPDYESATIEACLACLRLAVTALEAP